MKDYFSLATNNLRRRKLRSWLTMVGIFIGIAAVVALISLGQGLQDAVREEFVAFGSDKITISEKGTTGPPGSGTSSLTKLTQKDIETIKKVSGVKGVAGVLIKTGAVEFKDEIKFVFIYGAPQEDEQKEIVNFFDIEKGRDLKKGDRNKVVIGINHAQGKVFEKEVDIGEKLTIEGKDFEVLGVNERTGNPFDDSAIIMEKESMRELFNLGDEEDLIYAQVDNLEDVDRVRENIERALRKERKEDVGKETFQVETAQEALETFTNIFSIVQIILVGIAGISLIVGGIGIANTMYTSVLERTKEIGTMKAVGAKNSDILKLFLIESGMLGLIGGVIGVAIGIALSKSVQAIATSQLGTGFLRASTDPVLIIGALIFSFLIGAISGVLPAVQASKLSPVEALRYE